MLQMSSLVLDRGISPLNKLCCSVCGLSTSHLGACDLCKCSKGNDVSAYVIFDVEICDPARYQEFMNGVKPALEAAGAKYLARGGAHKVYEGDWEPRRIVLLEFPSVDVWENFYNGATYQGLKHIRDACSSARLVSVVGL